MKCPSCLQDNPSSARFCNSCGAPLQPPASDAVPAGPSSFADGRYQVERTLGEGGKGVVYLCRDNVLGRRVAIKLIKEEVMDPDSQARFEREVQAMAQLLHPNVVTIFDIGQENGRYYLVLELMEGGSVEELISSAAQSRLDVPTALRIAQDTARGLAHAHGHGILHRDVKPGNIWMTGEGLAKLGDFGLAYLGGGVRLTRAGMMVGTVAYMAPEVALGRPADERSDLYMLGASLYEMVTGRVPFQGDDPVRVIFSHINDLPLSPQRLVPDLPPALETLINRLLAKDPEQRPDSATAVLAALESVGVGAVREPPLQPTPSHSDLPGQPPTPEPRWAQPLVGRDRERDNLRSMLDAAMQGQGGLVFITGEAGIGKTRLAAELRSYARGRGCQWLEGRFEKEGSIPLQPYVEAVRAYLRTAPPGSLPKLVGPYASELARAIPDIAAALGTTPPVPDQVEEDPETSRQRHLEAMCHLFVSIAGQAPLVLFLDDFQWAPSMDVLRALAQQVPGQPLLIVGAYRDVELRDKPAISRTVLAMNRDRLFQSLPLRRLSREEAGQMVAQALGQASTEELVDVVYQRTEGNPFFVEELVRYLVESGALTLEDEGWDLRETPSLQLPDSVKLVVEERLERLAEETRRAIAMASVIGQEFALSLLQEITGVEEDDLVEVVDQAVEARVLLPRPGVGQEVYAFADNQVREVLYEGTGTARRRRYHLRIGEAIEKVHARRLEEHYDALAQHFLEGNDLEKAKDYSIMAGDRASGIYSWARAISLYQTALELSEELEADRSEQAQILGKLAEVTELGQIAGAVDHWKKALSIYEALGDGKRAGALHLRLGDYYTGVSNRGEAYAHSLKAVELLESEGESPELAQAYALVGWYAAHGFGEKTIAIPMLERGLGQAERLDDPPAAISIARGLGHVLVYHRGEISRGLQMYRQGCEEARQSGDLVTLGLAASELSCEYAYLREPESALRWAVEARHSSEQAGTLRGQVYSGLSLAWARALLGDCVGALSGLETAQRAADRAGIELTPTARGPLDVIPSRVYIFMGGWDKAESELLRLIHDAGRRQRQGLALRWHSPVLGWLYLERDDLQGARRYLGEAAAFTQESGDDPPELGCRALLVQVECKSGDLEEAKGHMRRAQEILSLSPDWLGLAAEVHLAEGLLAAYEKRWEDAGTAYQKAADINRQYNLPYFEARSLLEWGEMYLARDQSGDRDHGMGLLDQALEIFQRVQASKMVEKVLSRKEVLTA